MDDILLNKAAIMERCLRRVAEEYAGTPSRLLDPTHQDAIVLNLERACQAAIDTAMYLVAQDHLGVPQASADAFTLLEKAGRLDGGLAGRLRAMVGFRNVVIHEYQKLNLDILRAIVESRGIDDDRESPSFEIIELLREKGAFVSYCDRTSRTLAACVSTTFR